MSVCVCFDLCVYLNGKTVCVSVGWRRYRVSWINSLCKDIIFLNPAYWRLKGNTERH